jgi:DNA invertase Pin-like site-specific DNA recombinase
MSGLRNNSRPQFKTIVPSLSPKPTQAQAAKTAVICARVSTDQQSEQGRSIPTQLQAMRQYATLHDINVVAELADDISGTIPIRQRPDGARLYQFIDGRKCDAVIFFAVDRVTRDEDLIEINVIRRDVRNAGMELHYAADGGKADLSTWGGVIDTLKAAGAAEERRKIVERTQRGRKAKAQAGKWVGGNAPPYGYRKVGKGRETTLEIDAFEAAIVRRIFESYVGLRTSPMSLFAIKQALNAEGVPSPGRYGRAVRGKRGWHQTIIAAILRRKAYAGTFTYAGVAIHLPALAIVSEQVHEQAVARLSDRAKHIYARKNPYLLSGRLRCVCGRSMLGYTLTKPNGKSHRYYRCADCSENTTQRVCRERMVRADWVEAEAWAWLKRIATDDDYLRDALAIKAEREADDSQPKRDLLAALDNDITKQTRKLQRLAGAYGEADDNEAEAIKTESKETSRKLDLLKAERDDLAREVGQGAANKAQRESIVAALARIRGKIENADFAAQRVFVGRLDVRGRMIYESEARKIRLNLAILEDSPNVADSLSIKLIISSHLL